MVRPSPLLETKLYIPRLRRGLVTRPRLSERLNRGGESKLTLVSTPAGFGKTTLLAEWLAATPVESCRPNTRKRFSQLFEVAGREMAGVVTTYEVL
jgi:hypothetical protein